VTYICAEFPRLSSAAAANSAGLTVDGAGATLLYTSATDSWNINKAFISNSFINTTGNISAALGNFGNIIAGGVRQTVSASAPSNPTVGDHWYDTGTDILFKFTNDGTNTVWVDISGMPLNTNVATIQGTSLSITGNGTISGAFTAGALSVNSQNAATAIVNGGSAGVGNIGSSVIPFNTVYAKATTAQYADLAEIYVGDAEYAPGTVVIFGGDHEVTISTNSHDSRVAGVVSTNPAYLMNSATEGIAVALQGRVLCQVQGPISKGDLVVTSSISGVAQRLTADQYVPGCVIGKSLEIIENNEIATIEVVIGRV
jgi:hypothetical protein